MSGDVDFLGAVGELKPRVYEVIKRYLPDREPREHYDMVREYPERQGKYVRPGLLLLSCRMFGGDAEKGMLTAAAMQTSEDWILIHDDILDHSEERRKKPTLHRQAGVELAINAGDALHMIMWKMLGDNADALGAPVGRAVFDKMYEILMVTAEGQYIEGHWIRDKVVDVVEDEYYGMIRRKAAWYTIIGPLQLGALVAGASPEDVGAWVDVGMPFGCGFQIWDDVMNLSVDASKQGKERAGDILEGKRTLMLIHLLRHCSPVEKQQVLSIYRKHRKEKTLEERDLVLGLMETYGSIEFGKERAQAFAQQARGNFDKAFAHVPDSDAKRTIRAGIGWVVDREH